MSERQIGSYRILKQIGSGGMAKVYLAVHKDVPNLRVVLKILSNPQHAARFMQEADKLAQLDKNPNICHIKGLFYDEDELVIAMEYIDGKSLEEMLVEKPVFSIGETIAIVADLLAALGAAHEKAIFHRDIKPSNVMFEKDGQLKIIDFGIAKGKTDPRMTIEGTAAGTPEYMAPEQFEGGERIDYAKCDIYAVGTILYRMLTGRLPFAAENPFVIRDKKLYEDPAPPPQLNKEISAELGRLVLKSIDRDPGKRFASIAEMRSELLRIAGRPSPKAEASTARAVPAPGTAPAREKRPGRASRSGGKIAAMAAAGVVIAVAAVFAIRMLGGGDRENGSAGQERDGGATVPAAPAKAVTIMTDTTRGDAPRADTSHAAPPRGDTSGAARRPVVRQPPVAKGSLRVSSRPPRAEIYINDELQEHLTPYTFELPPGQYTVRIRAFIGGTAVVHSETVTVQSGAMKNVHHNFEE